MCPPAAIRPKRASIRDVAKRAGVSHTTVSLILNGKLTAAPETRERVLDAARELGYQPDANFRKAVAERVRDRNGERPKVNTQILALVLPQEMYDATQNNDGYYSQVFAGACQAASDAGWHILLCPQKENPAGIPKVLQDGRADGILLEGPFPKDWLALLTTQFPCAFINNCHPELDALCVTPNWELTGYQLVEYAWQKGHRDFVFFRHDAPSENLLQISRGHQKALEALGGSLLNPRLSRPWPIRPGNTAKVVDDFLDEWEAASPRPTVILTTDFYASCIAKALTRRGIRVPDDVSIIGRENRSFSMLNNPPLTTYSYPVREIGRMATRMLIQALREDALHPSHIMLKGALAERDSVKNLNP